MLLVGTYKVDFHGVVLASMRHRLVIGLVYVCDLIMAKQEKHKARNSWCTCPFSAV